MQQIYNVLIATLLSFLVIIGWNFFFAEYTHNNTTLVQKKVAKKEYRSSRSVLQENRVQIKNNKVSGSVSLQGLFFDDLLLTDYLDESGKNYIFLLKPHATRGAYFLDFGWMSNDDSLEVPTKDTIWKADGQTITPQTPVTFSWENKEGVIFKVKVGIDAQYMLSIEKIIENYSRHDISLASYTTINRNFNEFSKNMLITHEGPIGVIKDKLIEIKYKDLLKKEWKFILEEFKEHRKWFGFSDKYWLVSQVTDSIADEKLYIRHSLDKNNDHIFKIATINPHLIIKSGFNSHEEEHFFAGPKELAILENYEKSMDIIIFNRAVDFGILYFITKPIFILLQSFYKFVGNFGVAIILLTLFVRIAMLPLSIKSCSSMIRMKELQPEIAKLKQLYKDDKAKLNKESIALFKKHNVTPVSGCFPTLLQIPVFFALYKVLFITIEMRQASFFGWIKDLAVPDPTNFFNLFGLISWAPPAMLSIGVLPIVLGITMAIQQKLTATHYEDKTQAFMARSMPYLFTVLFASFPSGLVLYWIFNNLISIAQQVIVKKYLTYKMCKNLRKVKV